MKILLSSLLFHAFFIFLITSYDVVDIVGSTLFVPVGLYLPHLLIHALVLIIIGQSITASTAGIFLTYPASYFYSHAIFNWKEYTASKKKIAKVSVIVFVLTIIILNILFPQFG